MIARKLSYLPEALVVFYKHNILQRFFSHPFNPRAMHFVATHRCNARCIMCGIWRESRGDGKEMSLSELDRVLDDRLFSRLKYVGISGGEPFLRDDIAEVAGLFHQKCPSLKRVSITTNGILTGRIEAAAGRLVKMSKERGVLLDISVSCHALNGLLARIYGVANAFNKIQATVDVLKKYRQDAGLSFSLNCVLLNNNLDGAASLTEWARENEIPITFVVGEQRDRFVNKDMQETFIGPPKREKLLSFLKKMSKDVSFGNFSALRYNELIKLLEGRGERSLCCYYALGGFVLGHNGTLYYCSHSRKIGNCQEKSAYQIFYDRENLKYRREELIQKECRRCPPYTLTRWELQANIHRVLALVGKEKLRSMFGASGRDRRKER